MPIAQSLFMLRLKRGPPTGGVRTLHLLGKYPSRPRSSWSVVFRPHLIFLTSPPFFSSASLWWDPYFCCDCAVRVTSLKRRRGDHVSAGRKEAGVFSHSSDSPGSGWKNTTARRRLWLDRSLASARSQTSKQHEDSPVLSPARFSSSLVFGVQGHGEIKGAVRLNLRHQLVQL